jgi:hypothetical protein
MFWRQTDPGVSEHGLQEVQPVYLQTS